MTSRTGPYPSGRGHRHRGGRTDRGSAAIWLLAVGAVVVAFGLTATMAGAATVARHRAQAAADLGALAGARYAAGGAELACGRAGEIVSANGARLAGCRLDGLDLVVTVEVAAAGLGRGFGPARASARAGPDRAAAGHTHAMPGPHLGSEPGGAALRAPGDRVPVSQDAVAGPHPSRAGTCAPVPAREAGRRKVRGSCPEPWLLSRVNVQPAAHRSTLDG